MMSAARQNRGFSLIEMIVYIAVLMVVATGSILLLFSLDDLFAKYRAEQLVMRSASMVFERMLHDIRDAETVFGFSHASPGSLTLSGGAATMQYATSGEALHVSENGVDLGALTESGVVVEHLRFYGYTDSTEFARVMLTLSATVNDHTVRRTFYSGAVVRGSYAQ